VARCQFGDAGADDPPADDEQVESLRPQPLEAGRTRVLHPRRTLPVAAEEADTRTRTGDLTVDEERFRERRRGARRALRARPNRERARRPRSERDGPRRQPTLPRARTHRRGGSRRQGRIHPSRHAQSSVGGALRAHRLSEVRPGSRPLLTRLADERDTSLRNVRLAASTLEALQTKHHDLAEKMLLRFLS
jgi:hypothetical protein